MTTSAQRETNHDPRHLGKHLILAELPRRHDASTGPQMTRMKRMRKTAATRTTTASRPLFENRTKIGPALARTSTMDDVQREEQRVPVGGTRRSAVSVKTSIVRE
jgi:hypothetical protein